MVNHCITSTCSKAKQILGLLYRCFYGSASSASLKQLYLSMVRPHLAKSGILTLLKTRRNWRTCKCLPAGWHHTNGMLATKTYYNCTNYQLWRSVDCTDLKLGLIFKIIHNLCYYPDTPSFRDNFHSRASCSCIPI